MEVWFVALGSELAGNGGMRAFVETHEAELKGSIIIELEALGAGELTLMDREGTYLPKKASSRMKPARPWGCPWETVPWNGATVLRPMP